MNVSEALSRFIVETTYDNLPADVVEAAKIAILDGVANMVAGATQELADIIGNFTRSLGGNDHCSVIGWGFKTNAPGAAFANGVFGHCLDYEIQGFPPTHGTSSCLPSALALGEIRHAPGRTIIEAYALGWDIQGRMRAASAPASNPAFHPPGMVGPLGGAAASAKVLGLDVAQTRMALGIAASRTGGLTANTGTMVKSTHPGNAARMGAEAAFLAGMGYTASEDVFESPVGYAAALFGGNVDWDILTGNFGDPWRLVDPSYDIKRFPAQVYMQNPIEAVLNLRQEHGIDADMVDRLVIHRRGRGHSGPVPNSGLDGKFSVEYCAAAALLDGQVVIDTFTDERRFAADMEEALRKVQVDPDADDNAGVRVTAHLKDGGTATSECRSFKGSAGNPMSREERMDKVWDCIGRAMSRSNGQRVIDLVEGLEEVVDISELMDILGQASPARA